MPKHNNFIPRPVLFRGTGGIPLRNKKIQFPMRSRSFIERSLEGALSFLKESVFADEYAAKGGFLQARDPRAKTGIILFLVLAVLFSKSLFFIGGVYLLCLLLAWTSCIHLVFFLKRTWFFIPLFSLCIALPALFDIFTPGEPLVNLRIFYLSLSITKQGMASAGIFFARVLTSVSLCVLLALTTRHYCMLKVLRVFKVPQFFVMTLGMCYRYVYLFIEIVQNTYTAIKSRCGYLSSSRKGQNIVAWNIASLWQRSYDLHIQVYGAMLSRGYNGDPRIIEEFRMTAKDTGLFVLAVFLFIGVLWKTYFLN